jgi:ABC-type spermidine/putrescine transport system permease subunit I
VTRRPRAAGTEHLLAALPIAWLTVLFVVPLALTVLYSFGTSSFGSVELGFSPANYVAALSPLYLATFVRTVVFALGCSAACIVAAYPIAYLIARRLGRFRTVAFALVLVPYFASLLVRVMAWQIIAAWFGILDTRAAIVIGTIAVYLPITVLALTLVLERIPQATLEAARDLGASGGRTFWHVVLPLSRPGIATAALLTAVPMLGELVLPQLLGGGKGLLVGQAIATQYGQSQNYALGSAMVVLLVLVIGVLVALLLRLTRGFEARA